LNAQSGLTPALRAGLQALADHASFQQLLPASQALPPPPRFHFGDFPASLAAKYYRLSELGPAGVWSSDALIVGPGLLLRTLDGALIKAAPLNWVEHHIDIALGRTGGLTNEAPALLDSNAVLMMTGGYPIYGHWLADILPRLILLERAGYGLDDLTFLVPADVPDFALALLDLIGIDAARLHLLSGPVRPRLLLMPTFPHNGLQFMGLAPDGFRLLNARVSARHGRLASTGNPARILVSRQGYGSRPLQNRAAFEALAEEFGFVRVSPQTLPLIEQVRLFGGAQAILGEYGSGLHNSIFSPAGTVVAGVRGTLEHPAFLQSGIGDALQHPTGYIFGSCGDHVNHPDFRVDLDMVRDCLRVVFPAGRPRTAYQPALPVAPSGGRGASPESDALGDFRHAQAAGNVEAALAAGDLLTQEGDDVHGIAPTLAAMSRQIGRDEKAVRYAIMALASAPDSLDMRRILSRVLPAEVAYAPVLGDTLDINFLNEGNAVPMLGRGWGRHAPRQRWMLHKVSTLTLPALDAGGDWLCDMDAMPGSVPARLRILLDWVELRRFVITDASETVLRFHIPAEVLAGVTPHTLRFEHPDCRTPRSVDGREDDRLLAFGVRRLRLKKVFFSEEKKQKTFML
jgi:capsular polysaccharide biosynthesis protein